MTDDPSGRVHIVDDDELVRARMSFFLSNRGYSTEIYTGGHEFFCDSRVKRGCILLDVCMPQMSGHEVQEELIRLGSTLPVVVMSAYRDIPGVVRALRLGATDFVEKPLSEEDLLAAVGRALESFATSGGRRNVTVAAAARLSRISRRQRQVLQGLLDGLHNKEIARRLGISRRTVEMHRAKLKRELGVSGLSQALQFAIDAGLTHDSEDAPLDPGRQRTDSGASVGA